MRERVSEAEQEVMEILWGYSPLSANDIAERLSGKKRWQESTVKTLLTRLVSKGAVKYEKDGRRYLYSPAYPRSIFVQAESKRLIDRLFDGRVSPLVAHLAEHDGLSEDDIKSLSRIIEGLKDHDD